MDYKKIEKILQIANDELFNELDKLGNMSLTGKDLNQEIMQSKKITKNHLKLTNEIKNKFL